MIRLQSGRHTAALHVLRDDAGPTLLCLHALRGRASDFAELAPAWPGRVLALDFSGHGASDHPRGGSYTPELLASDADAALAHAGGALRVVGVGIGAYVALLLAGARPALVRAAYLLPGAGLEGGGPTRSQLDADAWRREADALLDAATQREADALRDAAPRREGGAIRDATPRREGPDCDPMVRMLDGDARPPDYARSFADAATKLLLGEDGSLRPIWWEAAREAPSALRAPADARLGLALLRAGAET